MWDVYLIFICRYSIYWQISHLHISDHKNALKATFERTGRLYWTYQQLQTSSHICRSTLSFIWRKKATFHGWSRWNHLESHFGRFHICKSYGSEAGLTFHGWSGWIWSVIASIFQTSLCQIPHLFSDLTKGKQQVSMGGLEWTNHTHFLRLMPPSCLPEFHNAISQDKVLTIKEHI